MSAGMQTPPTAASMGSAAWRGRRSWPTVVSYLSSMPTSRKKTAMRKSFTNCSTVSETSSRPTPTISGSSRMCSTPS